MKPNDTVKTPHGPSHGPTSDPLSDDPASTPAAQKAGLLPTGLSRAIVIGSTIFLVGAIVIGLLGDRYSLIASTRTENAFAFRIDHLTGRVSFCSPASCLALPDKIESAK